jgi:hypothetical protein
MALKNLLGIIVFRVGGGGGVPSQTSEKGFIWKTASEDLSEQHSYKTFPLDPSFTYRNLNSK